MAKLSRFKIFNIILISIATYLYFSSSIPSGMSAKTSEVVDEAEERYTELPTKWVHVDSLTLEPGQTFFSLLLKLGIDGTNRAAILTAAKKVYDVRYLRPGVKLHAFAKEEAPTEVLKMNFVIGKTQSLYLFVNEFSKWEAVLTKKEIATEIVQFQGSISTSLWESAMEAGLSWDIISKLTSVFAWQIDFARELRTGDRYRFTVEKLSVDGEFLGYGQILAAEFENNSELHQAIYYDAKDQSGYFDLDGKSLKKMFLKSPVKFSRITSKFNKRRFHPVLKTYKAHNGVDYGAAPGTPVYATGDGIVRIAGWRGAAGKHVQVQHNSTYQTGYSHLKKIAPGVRKGMRVKQGQIIGYVGATGRVTGPHLHFAFYENGVFIDPLGRKFPAADPLKQSHLTEFREKAHGYLSGLPDWRQRDQM